jgi:hypothetical protein
MAKKQTKKKTKKKQTKQPKINIHDKNSFVMGAGILGVRLRQEIQIMRKAIYNRKRDLIRRKVEGIPYDRPEPKKTDEQKQKIQEKYTDKKLAKIEKELRKKEELNKNELTKLDTINDLILNIQGLEKDCEKSLVNPYAKKTELYQRYYRHIKGVGPVLCAELIHDGGDPAGFYIDEKNKQMVEKCPTPASLRKYCMMDPAGAKGRKRGEKAEGSPTAKTLWWKISSQMMMAKNDTFMQLYKKRKAFEIERMENGEEGAAKNKMHVEARAKRYAIQKFINWHWVISRQLAGYATNKGWIFEIGEESEDGKRIKHGANKYLMPPYIPAILLDSNGNWDPDRPAGWIFKQGKKDWSEADNYIRKLCGKEPITYGKKKAKKQKKSNKKMTATQLSASIMKKLNTGKKLTKKEKDFLAKKMGGSTSDEQE